MEKKGLTPNISAMPTPRNSSTGASSTLVRGSTGCIRAMRVRRIQQNATSSSASSHTDESTGICKRSRST